MKSSIGYGFYIDKERWIIKDDKVIFTTDQMTALIVYCDICKAIREKEEQESIKKSLDDFFGKGKGL